MEAAVGDVPGLEASRLEIDRGGESYTADTLAELRRVGPGDELFLIVGWDVAGELASWERHDEIQKLATLVVVNRPGAGRPPGLDAKSSRVVEVTVPNLEISSTDLRARRCQRPAARLSGSRGRGALHTGARYVRWRRMTTVRSAAPTAVTAGADGSGPGERLRRLRQRRRLVREELLAVAILVIALVATLVVLGLQWLGSGQSVTPTTGPPPAYNIIGGLT